jgi:FtsP/CotA-like multicopper oxidase with cupredoxin domain
MPQAVPVPSLNPAPTIAPNTAAGESRTRNHQGFAQFPPNRFFSVFQQAFRVSQSPGLPLQTLWGYNDGSNLCSPGPTYASRYFASRGAQSNLVRNHNALPPEGQNGGFGKPSVTTHLHNGHTPSESDGFPCDFFEIGHFYDQHYPNVLAGINSTNPGTGDINESLSTLWYHDHRVDFTSQNTYKGLLGFYLLFNDFDTGDEDSGFRLPSYPDFDIPLAFADKVYDANGLLAFDLFNLDGILGDKFLVNGRIQPFFNVQPRRYRFRLLDTGPSRFYEFFLTDLNNLGTANPFWVIANDGNLLPAPVKVTSVRTGVAERVDIIIDFRQFAGKTIYLENRLNQLNGQGPVINSPGGTGATECNCPEILPAGGGNLLLQFRVSGQSVRDDSADPSTQRFYNLPQLAQERITRTFKFDRLNGQWSINGQFMDCNNIRFRVGQNSVENWILSNATGDWTHPVHIHLEEHRILSRNRAVPPLAIENSRKDVSQLHPDERVRLFFRFRDWLGRYPLHCHNVVHEDHAMMLRWEVVPDGGDNVEVP